MFRIQLFFIPYHLVHTPQSPTNTIPPRYRMDAPHNIIPLESSALPLLDSSLELNTMTSSGRYKTTANPNRSIHSNNSIHLQNNLATGPTSPTSPQLCRSSSSYQACPTSLHKESNCTTAARLPQPQITTQTADQTPYLDFAILLSDYMALPECSSAHHKISITYCNSPFGSYVDENSGQIMVRSDIARSWAKMEMQAIKNRIVLCGLTLTIPLFMYLKLVFWSE